MLSIKKSLRSYLPQLPYLRSGTTQMQLSPVLSDTDELIQAIEDEIVRHDDNWMLEVTPDTEKLEQGWAAIQQDIEHDPKWFKFDDE